MSNESISPETTSDFSQSRITNAEIAETLKDLSESGPIRITDENDIESLPVTDVKIGTVEDADEAITIIKPATNPKTPENVIDLAEARRRLRDIPKK